jgi:phosphohistidine phosphatase SixA
LTEAPARPENPALHADEGVDEVLLLRHASAGERRPSATLDRARRLDRFGRADARELPEALAGHRIERVLSSPHARCVETVDALALRRNLKVEVHDSLLPDAPLEDVLVLLAELPDAALVCTHREVVGRLFGGELTCEKGATWLLERRDGALEPVAYLPAPSSVPRAVDARGLTR